MKNGFKSLLLTAVLMIAGVAGAGATVAVLSNVPDSGYQQSVVTRSLSQLYQTSYKVIDTIAGPIVKVSAPGGAAHGNAVMNGNMIPAYMVELHTIEEGINHADTGNIAQIIKKYDTSWMMSSYMTYSPSQISDTFKNAVADCSANMAKVKNASKTVCDKPMLVAVGYTYARGHVTLAAQASSDAMARQMYLSAYNNYTQGPAFKYSNDGPIYGNTELSTGDTIDEYIKNEVIGHKVVADTMLWFVVVDKDMIMKKFDTDVSTRAQLPEKMGGSDWYHNSEPVKDHITLTAKGGHDFYDIPAGAKAEVTVSLCRATSTGRSCVDKKQNIVTDKKLIAGNKNSKFEFDSEEFSPQGQYWDNGMYWFDVRIKWDPASTKGFRSAQEEVYYTGWQTPSERWALYSVAPKTRAVMKGSQCAYLNQDLNNGKNQLTGCGNAIAQKGVDLLRLQGEDKYRQNPIFDEITVSPDVPLGNNPKMVIQRKFFSIEGTELDDYFVYDSILHYSPLGGKTDTNGGKYAVKQACMQASNGKSMPASYCANSGKQIESASANSTYPEFVPGDLGMSKWEDGYYWFDVRTYPNKPGRLFGGTSDNDAPKGKTIADKSWGYEWNGGKCEPDKPSVGSGACVDTDGYADKNEAWTIYGEPPTAYTQAKKLDGTILGCTDINGENLNTYAMNVGESTPVYDEIVGQLQKCLDKNKDANTQNPGSNGGMKSQYLNNGGVNPNQDESTAGWDKLDVEVALNWYGNEDRDISANNSKLIQKRVKTKTFQVWSGDGSYAGADIESDAFKPSDFGWQTWPIGRYWFDVIIRPQQGFTGLYKNGGKWQSSCNATSNGAQCQRTGAPGNDWKGSNGSDGGRTEGEDASKYDDDEWASCFDSSKDAKGNKQSPELTKLDSYSFVHCGQKDSWESWTIGYKGDMRTHISKKVQPKGDHYDLSLSITGNYVRYNSQNPNSTAPGSVAAGNSNGYATSAASSYYGDSIPNYLLNGGNDYSSDYSSFESNSIVHTLDSTVRSLRAGVRNSLVLSNFAVKSVVSNNNTHIGNAVSTTSNYVRAIGLSATEMSVMAVNNGTNSLLRTANYGISLASSASGCYYLDDDDDMDDPVRIISGGGSAADCERSYTYDGTFMHKGALTTTLDNGTRMRISEGATWYCYEQDSHFACTTSWENDTVTATVYCSYESIGGNTPYLDGTEQTGEGDTYEEARQNAADKCEISTSGYDSVDKTFTDPTYSCSSSGYCKADWRWKYATFTFLSHPGETYATDGNTQDSRGLYVDCPSGNPWSLADSFDGWIKASGVGGACGSGPYDDGDTGEYHASYTITGLFHDQAASVKNDSDKSTQKDYHPGEFDPQINAPSAPATDHKAWQWVGWYSEKQGTAAAGSVGKEASGSYYKTDAKEFYGHWKVKATFSAVGFDEDGKRHRGAPSNAEQPDEDVNATVPTGKFADGSTVKTDDNGNTIVDCPGNEDMTKLDPYGKGYLFVGWYPKKGNGYDKDHKLDCSGNAEYDNDTEFVAVYKKGGLFSDNGNITAQTGDLTYKPLDKSGDKTFVCWSYTEGKLACMSDNADFQGEGEWHKHTQWDAIDKPIVYAIYENQGPIGHFYTGAGKFPDGTDKYTDQNTMQSDNIIDCKKPDGIPVRHDTDGTTDEKDDWIFVGWFTTPQDDSDPSMDRTNEVDCGDTYEAVGGKTEFFAHWYPKWSNQNDPIKTDGTFDANGGKIDGQDSVTDPVPDDFIIDCPADPTWPKDKKPQQVFQGWYDDKGNKLDCSNKNNLYYDITGNNAADQKLNQKPTSYHAEWKPLPNTNPGKPATSTDAPENKPAPDANGDSYAVVENVKIVDTLNTGNAQYLDLPASGTVTADQGKDTEDATGVRAKCIVLKEADGSRDKNANCSIPTGITWKLEGAKITISFPNGTKLGWGDKLPEGDIANYVFTFKILPSDARLAEVKAFRENDANNQKTVQLATEANGYKSNYDSYTPKKFDNYPDIGDCDKEYEANHGADRKAVNKTVDTSKCYDDASHPGNNPRRTWYDDDTGVKSSGQKGWYSNVEAHANYIIESFRPSNATGECKADPDLGGKCHWPATTQGRKVVYKMPVIQAPETYYSYDHKVASTYWYNALSVNQDPDQYIETCPTYLYQWAKGTDGYVKDKIVSKQDNWTWTKNNANGDPLDGKMVHEKNDDDKAGTSTKKLSSAVLFDEILAGKYDHDFGLKDGDWSSAYPDNSPEVEQKEKELTERIKKACAQAYEENMKSWPSEMTTEGKGLYAKGGIVRWDKQMRRATMATPSRKMSYWMQSEDHHFTWDSVEEIKDFYGDLITDKSGKVIAPAPGEHNDDDDKNPNGLPAGAVWTTEKRIVSCPAGYKPSNKYPTYKWSNNGNMGNIKTNGDTAGGTGAKDGNEANKEGDWTSNGTLNGKSALANPGADFTGDATNPAGTGHASDHLTPNMEDLKAVGGKSQQIAPSSHGNLTISNDIVDTTKYEWDGEYMENFKLGGEQDITALNWQLNCEQIIIEDGNGGKVSGDHVHDTPESGVKENTDKFTTKPTDDPIPGGSSTQWPKDAKFENNVFENGAFEKDKVVNMDFGGNDVPEWKQPIEPDNNSEWWHHLDGDTDDNKSTDNTNENTKFLKDIYDNKPIKFDMNGRTDPKDRSQSLLITCRVVEQKGKCVYDGKVTSNEFKNGLANTDGTPVATPGSGYPHYNGDRSDSDGNLSPLPPSNKNYGDCKNSDVQTENGKEVPGSKVDCAANNPDYKPNMGGDKVFQSVREDVSHYYILNILCNKHDFQRYISTATKGSVVSLTRPDGQPILDANNNNINVISGQDKDGTGEYTTISYDNDGDTITGKSLSVVKDKDGKVTGVNLTDGTPIKRGNGSYEDPSDGKTRVVTDHNGLTDMTNRDLSEAINEADKTSTNNNAEGYRWRANLESKSAVAWDGSWWFECEREGNGKEGDGTCEKWERRGSWSPDDQNKLWGYQKGKYDEVGAFIPYYHTQASNDPNDAYTSDDKVADLTRPVIQWVGKNGTSVTHGIWDPSAGNIVQYPRITRQIVTNWSGDGLVQSSTDPNKVETGHIEGIHGVLPDWGDSCGSVENTLDSTCKATDYNSTKANGENDLKSALPSYDNANYNAGVKAEPGQGENVKDPVYTRECPWYCESTNGSIDTVSGGIITGTDLFNTGKSGLSVKATNAKGEPLKEYAKTGKWDRTDTLMLTDAAGQVYNGHNDVTLFRNNSKNSIALDPLVPDLTGTAKEGATMSMIDKGFVSAADVETAGAKLGQLKSTAEDAMKKRTKAITTTFSKSNTSTPWYIATGANELGYDNGSVFRKNGDAKLGTFEAQNLFDGAGSKLKAGFTQSTHMYAYQRDATGAPIGSTAEDTTEVFKTLGNNVVRMSLKNQEALDPNVQTFAGAITTFDIKSYWATEEGYPIHLDVEWEYQMGTGVPVTNGGFTAGFQTIATDKTHVDKEHGNKYYGTPETTYTISDGKCIYQPHWYQKDNPDRTTDYPKHEVVDYFHDKSGFGTVPDKDRPGYAYGYANEKRGLDITFVRGSAE